MTNIIRRQYLYQTLITSWPCFVNMIGRSKTCPSSSYELHVYALAYIKISDRQFVLEEVQANKILIFFHK